MESRIIGRLRVVKENELCKLLVVIGGIRHHLCPNRQFTTVRIRFTSTIERIILIFLRGAIETLNLIRAGEEKVPQEGTQRTTTFNLLVSEVWRFESNNNWKRSNRNSNSNGNIKRGGRREGKTVESIKQ